MNFWRVTPHSTANFERPLEFYVKQLLPGLNRERNTKQARVYSPLSHRIHKEKTQVLKGVHRL